MSFVRIDLAKRVLRLRVLTVIATVGVLSGTLMSVGHADPAQDPLAELRDLTRQAEQTSEAVNAAQIDLNSKVAAQTAAENQHTQDLATAESAKTTLGNYQTDVDKFAVATYMGGRTDEFNALLVATTPQGLIDQLAVQDMVNTQMQTTMSSFRTARDNADRAEAASAKSAAEAKIATEAAVAVRNDLVNKQNALALKIAVVKSRYNVLTPQQRNQWANPTPAVQPPAILAAPAPGLPEAAPDAPAPEAAPDSPADAVPPGDVGAPEGVIASPLGSTVVQAALTRVGSPYSWGAAGPGAFDCSGLVMWAFQQAGVSLPHSSQALARGGMPVSRGDLQPGDVVNYYGDASHTGIYVGDGLVVHASTYGQPVRVVPLDGAGPFYNARRY